MGSPTGSEDSGVHVFVGRSLRAVAQACGRRRDTRDLAGSALSPPPLPPSLLPRPPLPPTPGPPRQPDLSPWGGGGGGYEKVPGVLDAPPGAGARPRGGSALAPPRPPPYLSRPHPRPSGRGPLPCASIGAGVTG